MMNEGEGDISVMLSSALISKITQEYFNKVMFKQRVEIVDLRPANDGYMFVVAFAGEVKATPQEVVSVPSYVTASLQSSVLQSNGLRDEKGQFIKVKGE